MFAYKKWFTNVIGLRPKHDSNPCNDPLEKNAISDFLLTISFLFFLSDLGGTKQPNRLIWNTWQATIRISDVPNLLFILVLPLTL